MAFSHCTYLPRTRTHATRSGGLHMLFRHREGMRNSASRIAEGIDVRGDGGYIIWWPAAGLDIVDRSPAAQWPAWLAEQAMPPPPSKMDPAATEQTLRDADRYAAGAVRAAIQSVLTAPQGRRNDTLNGEVYSLARFVPQGLLTAGQIAQAMAAAGLQAGLNQREIEKTIASAAGKDRHMTGVSDFTELTRQAMERAQIEGSGLPDRAGPIRMCC